VFMDATPVMFPPGLFRLATRPSSTGSPPPKNTIGMLAFAALTASAAAVTLALATMRPHAPARDRPPIPSTERGRCWPRGNQSRHCGLRRNQSRSILCGRLLLCRANHHRDTRPPAPLAAARAPRAARQPRYRAAE
jgi:hypothetical protein